MVSSKKDVANNSHHFSCFQVDLRGLHLPFGTMAVAINSEPAEVKKLRSWKTMAPLKGESDESDDDQF